MTQTTLPDTDLIAPCGINCRLCRANTRQRKACPGCRGEDTNKANTCINCRIRNCEKLLSGGYPYCFECSVFPCSLLAHLDKRYRTRYWTSPIANLESIRRSGILDFVASENMKWACPGCGALLCMHEAQCLACGYGWHQQ